jgi:ABC-2 type transport system ATP-binding protein
LSVEVERLSYRYGERLALDEVSFDVRPGEFFALVGPNGGGKTTLFRILSTALPPQDGHARVAGRDVRDPEVRRGIGVVFQSPSLDKKLTVRENLLHHGHLYGLRGQDLKSRIEEMLGRFKLADRAGERAERLSGGMQRRVELAKAMLHRPGVLLLDEPSTGLDPGARRELADLLGSLSGVTVLQTTHLLEEAERSGRVGILHKGRLVALGAPRELASQIGGDVVTVRTRDPSGLGRSIEGKYGLHPQISEGSVRLVRERGHELSGALAGDFGDRIESVTVARPTLEDVFLAKTQEAWS